MVKPAAAFLQANHEPAPSEAYRLAALHQMQHLRSRALAHRLVAAMAADPPACRALGVELPENSASRTMSEDFVCDMRMWLWAARTGEPEPCECLGTRSQTAAVAAPSDAEAAAASAAAEAAAVYTDAEVEYALVRMSSLGDNGAAHTTIKFDIICAHEDDDLSMFESLSTLTRPVVLKPECTGPAAANEGVTAFVGYRAALDVSENIMAVINGNDIVHLVGAPIDARRQGGHHRVRIADHWWAALGPTQQARFRAAALRRYGPGGLGQYGEGHGVQARYQRADHRERAG